MNQGAEVVTFILILIGLVAIIFAIIPAMRLLLELKTEAFRKDWLTVVVLMFCFLGGYIGVIGLMLSKNFLTFEKLTAAIYFGGGLFVWFSVKVAVQAIHSLLAHQKELERELTEQQVRLISSTNLATLGETAAGIAHEINNPLTVILARAQVLIHMFETQKTVEPQDAIKNLKSIEMTVERIVKIIVSLRRLSRQSSTDTKDPVNFSRLLGDVHEILRQKFYDAGISLKMTVSSEETLQCRETEISQVLLNLINNAYDAVSGSPSPWVVVEQAVQEGVLRISVTDSGGGISKAVAARLFKPFFTTKTVGKGTGLGLSIASRIADDHGGMLFLDSTCSNTRFTLELPFPKSS